MADQQVPNGGELTPREREVLEMVAAGKTNREIGTALFISESTAGVHVSNIMAKLGVGSRTEAAANAIRAGLVEPGPGYVPPPVEEPVPADFIEPAPIGWFGRLKASIGRERQAHPRRFFAMVGSVAVLLVLSLGLAIAVVTAPSPDDNVAVTSPTSTAVASESEAASESASPSASAEPSTSPSATPDASSASTEPSASANPTTAAAPTPGATPLPIVGSWSLTGSLDQPRVENTATLLEDGTVLVFGLQHQYERQQC